MKNEINHCGSCCWFTRKGEYNAEWRANQLWMCGITDEEVERTTEACKYHPGVYGGNRNLKMRKEAHSLYCEAKERINKTEKGENLKSTQNLILNKNERDS